MFTTIIRNRIRSTLKLHKIGLRRYGYKITRRYTNDCKFIIVPKRFLTKHSNLRMRNIRVVNRIKNFLLY